ncbi:unnamed protein product [Sphenostylis stenocarpa]|uniref:Uncharacterized protein n=1 Tax=Sphenostylis stenocarpa TaxID=92480 RepID=A0AA86SEB8_9FABA|nr:unnamed protein product [Sphenostylis stenocarpa]
MLTRLDKHVVFRLIGIRTRVFTMYSGNNPVDSRANVENVLIESRSLDRIRSNDTIVVLRRCGAMYATVATLKLKGDVLLEKLARAEVEGRVAVTKVVELSSLHEAEVAAKIAIERELVEINNYFSGQIVLWEGLYLQALFILLLVE